ncbi:MULTISPECIES: HDOD domain-containing protein [Shewanella]|uniref:HDOD domain-containing protein n=1 Tax=Shewanella TaxID=22 RepID=UPI001C65A56D|nr:MULTISPECIES: HDOD domain-containing protein [Shewanella]QYJ83633.1 HDOD domain-containing protein [Shewanella aegiceratis]QYJ95011.1 HDOD domain-containing protein [Shewanella spartinae]
MSGKGAEYWTKRISEQEMPALSSTVKTLEKLAKDDVSSLAILGRSVMHDNALTSRILKVANSAIYNKGISHVTTVSRAAVVLGFDTIRNICITAKLLSSLLENKGLSEPVYHRLLTLMARAFQAAMLAKMMLKDHDEELQEEVFIAALLYHLGESAFWSMGGETTEQLDARLNQVDEKEANNVVREVLGTSFTQLSMGIAKNWGLGEVLVKSLSNPNERTPEIRSIYLANKISELMASDSKDIAELNHRIKQAADMLDLEVDEFKGRMIQCSHATRKLADTYGAKVLVAFLPDTHQLTLAAEPEAEPIKVREFNVDLQLKKLRELTDCAINKANFNEVITITLSGLLDGIGMDRCAVMLLSPNRKRLQPRVVLGENGDKMKNEFIVELNHDKNVFAESVDLKKPLFIDNPSSEKWRLYTDEELRRHTSAMGFMLAPILVDNKVIGLLYADRHSSERKLAEVDFERFTHFAQLTNLCLSVSVH